MTGAPSAPAVGSEVVHEAAVVGARLARKLGLGEALLIGCAHEAVVGGLGDLRLRGWDAEERLDAAARRRPDASWAPLETWPEAAAAAASAVVLLSSNVLESGQSESLGALLAAAPVTIVFDVAADGDVGSDKLDGMEGRARTLGAEVVYEGLVAGVHLGELARRNLAMLVLAPAGDVRVGQLMHGGPHGLGLDPHVDLTAAGDRASRVCIVSYEFTGPTQNGGIGTGYTALAQALARAGQDVTVAYTGLIEDPDAVTARWGPHYAELGIDFAAVGAPPDKSLVRSPHHNVRRAYEAYEWLLERQRENPYDVVHFPECQGHGYFLGLAKRHGVAFDDAVLVAGAHSSTRWCLEANRESFPALDYLVTEHLERRSVELADVVISPSAYMLDYMRVRGWRLPERRHVAQYVVSDSARALARRSAGARAGTAVARPPSELVFFGRIEVRKGVVAFCDALDLLAADPPADELEICFMGSETTVYGAPATSYIERRARAWPWKLTIWTSLGQAEAVEYLCTRPCVAVMPSLVDNSPNTVVEALALGIPFVASRSGGTAELIAARDLPRCSFDGWSSLHGTLEPAAHEQEIGQFDAAQLERQLRHVLESPLAPARFALDPDVNERLHVAWHAAHAQPLPAAKPAQLPATDISVCVIHRDDPEGLEDLLTSLPAERNGDVVVDDGSVQEGVGRRLYRLEADGFKVVRRTSCHRGAAADAAAAAVPGALLLYVETDHVAEPGMLDVVARAAARSDAEVFALAARKRDVEGHELVELPVGGPPVLGIMYPAFAYGGFAIRRSALERLGGFAAGAGGDEAVHDLLNRAALEGMTIDVIAEPVLRRTRPDDWDPVRSRGWADDIGWSYDSDQALRILRPYRMADSQAVAELASLYRATATRVAEQSKIAHRGWEAFEEHRAMAERLHREVLELGTENERLNRSLGAVEGSMSWRVTSPLRRGVQLLRDRGRNGASG